MGLMLQEDDIGFI